MGQWRGWVLRSGRGRRVWVLMLMVVVVVRIISLAPYVPEAVAGKRVPSMQGPGVTRPKNLNPKP